MRASHSLVDFHREDPVRPLLLRRVSVAAALLLSATVIAAQEVPYNQRVRFEAAPLTLDSTSVQLSVVHVTTAAPVRALVCFDSPQVITAATDETGMVRVSNLRRTNTRVRVVAPGFRETSLIFFPGKRGRSYAQVRVVPDPSAAATTPSCHAARD